MNYDDLRGILRYVPQFRGHTFVVLIDSHLLSHENLSNVMLDIALLHSLNIRVVVAFGARAQIAAEAEDRSIPISGPDATGVTDDTTLDLSVDIISRLTTDLLQHLTTVGIRAAVANAITVHPAGVIKGRDLGHTGSVDRVDVTTLQLLIDQGIIPLVPPLGYERQGRALRINSASVAVEVAVALNAAKLLFVGTNVIANSEGQRIRQLPVTEARELSAKDMGEITESSTANLLQHAARACEGGVQRVHFLDGRTDEALLGEIFSIEGVGTMVYGDDYQSIRPARRGDIDTITRMVRTAVMDEEIVERSRQEMRANIDHYFILEIDGQVLGTVSIQPWPEQRMAEVGCLYVRKSHEGRGYGRKLVQFAEKRAVSLHMSKLFALSTQAYNFFSNKLGYHNGEPEDLPPSRRDKLIKSGRNSRILIKSLPSS